MGVDTSPGQIGIDTETVIAFDRWVDWAIGAVLTVVGILVSLGGAILYYGITRSDVAEIVHGSEFHSQVLFHSEVLTEAQAIDALVGLGNWTGIGLVVAGGVLVVLGIAVVVAHGRARQAGRGTPDWILGVVGALVGSILSFVPFSPLLGGAAAGYLDPDPDSSGLGTGTLAGVFASVPSLVVAVFAGIGLLVSTAGEVVPAVVAILGITLVFSLFYLVGLSALGGYLGRWIRDR